MRRLIDYPIVTIAPLQAVLSNTWAFLTVLVVALAGCWIVFHAQTLDYYWNNDDLHLMRVYSPQELGQVFHGSWDVDYIETSGFRPFTTLFNHARYLLAGERQAVHRLILLGMMSLLLWIAGYLALQVGLGRGVVALALVVLVSTKVAAGDIVWIADGIHILENLLIGGSLMALFFFVRRRSLLWGAVSLLLAQAAFLTRESTIVLLLLAPVFLVVFSHSPSALAEQIFLTKVHLAYVAALYGMAGLTLLWGRHVVPDAATVQSFESLFGLFNHMLWSIWPVGWFIQTKANGGGFLACGGTCFAIPFIWGILLVALLILWLICPVSRTASRQVGVILLCVALGSTPGLVTQRENLVFFPTLFFSFAIAIAAIELWRVAVAELHGHGNLKIALEVFVVVLCLVAVVGSLQRSVVQTLDMHPYSLNQIERDYEMIYGHYASRATISADRRSYLVEKLERLGVRGPVTSIEQTLLRVYDEASHAKSDQQQSDALKIFVTGGCQLCP